MIRAAQALLRLATIDLRPLRRRDFRLLFTGQLVSLLGSRIAAVAAPFQIYLLTHSALALGLLGLVELGPVLAFAASSRACATRAAAPTSSAPTPWTWWRCSSACPKPSFRPSPAASAAPGLSACSTAPRRSAPCSPSPAAAGPDACTGRAGRSF